MIQLTLKWTDEKLEVKKEGIIILVDTLRASSVIPVALYGGAKEIIAVKNEDSARKLKEKYPQSVLAGERSGVVLEGFDCGNSPFQLLKISKGKNVVLTTGNFCKVIDIVANKGLPVIAASVVNAKETANYIVKQGYKYVFLIATGTYHAHGVKYEKPLRTEEDSVAALYIAYELSKISKINEGIFDRYTGTLGDKDKLIKFLWNTDYARYLLELDKKSGKDTNKKDMKVCFEINKYPCVPILKKKNSLFIFSLD